MTSKIKHLGGDEDHSKHGPELKNNLNLILFMSVIALLFYILVGTYYFL
ncbi:MAG: hypothetical protein HRU09_15055 [Oligoflexales bacterium]|nr:hypothetical protein [Oligoflexales bacterium]